MSEQTFLQIDAIGLGGPGAPDPQACARTAIAALSDVAGEGFRMTSLAIDVSSVPLGGAAVILTLKVDKRSRSILFVSAEARADGVMVFGAQGLFSRAG